MTPEKAAVCMIDYYELLQISPKADGETIHRVYRYLAARLHPDNSKTGDEAKFRLVKTAYDVLSHPLRRTEYDSRRSHMPPPKPEPLSSTVDFMDQFDGETNRRMAVLAVLYYRRRVSPNQPEVSLAELEERLGFPREYLDFTLWYLVKKKYLDRSDSVTYALTAEGVDFVEKERASVPVLNGLLTSSSTSDGSTPEAAEVEARAASAAPRQAVAKEATGNGRPYAYGSGPIVVPSPMKATATAERRDGRKDRRVGEADLRNIKVERRRGSRDRRAKD